MVSPCQYYWPRGALRIDNNLILNDPRQLATRSFVSKIILFFRRSRRKRRRRRESGHTCLQRSSRERYTIVSIRYLDTYLLALWHSTIRLPFVLALCSATIFNDTLHTHTRTHTRAHSGLIYELLCVRATFIVIRKCLLHSLVNISHRPSPLSPSLVSVSALKLNQRALKLKRSGWIDRRDRGKGGGAVG